MDGLDTLSSGLLSHPIIPPGKLAEIIRPCESEIEGTF